MQSPSILQKIALKYAHNAMQIALKRSFVFHFQPQIITPDFATPHAQKVAMLYIHIPFCHTICPYCSFHKYIYEKSVAEAYFKALRLEIEAVKARGFDFESIVVGGGTTLINEDELLKTLELCKKLFSVREISCESDPNHIEPHKLAQFKGLITRLSCGVQSFNDEILQKIGRYGKFGASDELIDKLNRANGILPILSIDLIFNFPFQAESQLRNDLQIAKIIAPQQITTYPLMKSPLTRENIANALGISAKDNEYAFYRVICEEFSDYERNNAWSFSTKNDLQMDSQTDLTRDSGQNLRQDSRHDSQRDSKHDSKHDSPQNAKNPINDEYVSYHNQYLGVGSGAFSFIGGRLFVNAFNIKDYATRISSTKSANIANASFRQGDILRYMFLTKLFSGAVDIGAFNRAHNCNVERDLFVEINGLRLSGAILHDGKLIKCTDFGRYLTLVAMKEFYAGMDMVRAVFRDSAKCSGKEILKVMEA